jgi:hypothetical protein
VQLATGISGGPNESMSSIADLFSGLANKPIMPWNLGGFASVLECRSGREAGMSSFPSLFQPLHIKKLRIRNRFLSASHSPGYAAGGVIGER